MNNNLRSQSLDLLRFPLAVVILLIHVFSCEVDIHEQTIGANSIPLLYKCSVIISGFLAQQSVPVYYFISGFVFFCSIDFFNKEVYIRKLRNRSKTLLIPYIIWNLISVMTVLITFLPIFSSYYPGLQEANLSITFQSIWSALWNYNGELVLFHGLPSGHGLSTGTFPINVPLWFVRDLMIVVLSTPVLYWLIKYLRFYAVLILGIVWFGSSYFELGNLNQLTVAFFFFSWGSYMSINRKDMLAEFRRFWTPSLVLYPSLAILYIVSTYYCPEVTDTIKRFNIVVGLFFAYNLSAWLLKNKVCKVSPFLAASSFFIYVSHCIIIGTILKILLIVLEPESEWMILLVFLLSAVVSLFLLLGVFYLLRNYMPSLLKVVVGRK